MDFKQLNEKDKLELVKNGCLSITPRRSMMLRAMLKSKGETQRAITLDYLKTLIEDNNKEYGTNFELRGAYGNFELWADGNRLEVGSKKDIYNAFIKYRFNEKYRKQAGARVEDKQEVTIKDISNVRYGRPGTILFDVKGKTYGVPEPTDIMPVDGGDASLEWALDQFLTHRPKEVKAKQETQLEMGIKVEMEHKQTIEEFRKKTEKGETLSDDQVAEMIAQDHLAEDPEYYTKLKKMEQGGKKSSRNSEYILNIDYSGGLFEARFVDPDTSKEIVVTRNPDWKLVENRAKRLGFKEIVYTQEAQQFKLDSNGTLTFKLKNGTLILGSSYSQEKHRGMVTYRITTPNGVTHAWKEDILDIQETPKLSAIKQTKFDEMVQEVIADKRRTPSGEWDEIVEALEASAKKLVPLISKEDRVLITQEHGEMTDEQLIDFLVESASNIMRDGSMQDHEGEGMEEPTRIFDNPDVNKTPSNDTSHSSGEPVPFAGPAKKPHADIDKDLLDLILSFHWHYKKEGWKKQKVRELVVKKWLEHPKRQSGEWTSDQFNKAWEILIEKKSMKIKGEGETIVEDESNEPQPEDIVMSDSGSLGSKTSVSIVDGKFLGEFDSEEEAEEFIRQWMAKNKFWPTVWYMDDHGGVQVRDIGKDEKKAKDDMRLRLPKTKRVKDEFAAGDQVIVDPAYGNKYYSGEGEVKSDERSDNKLPIYFPSKGVVWVDKRFVKKATDSQNMALTIGDKVQTPGGRGEIVELDTNEFTGEVREVVVALDDGGQKENYSAREVIRLGNKESKKMERKSNGPVAKFSLIVDDGRISDLKDIADMLGIAIVGEDGKGRVEVNTIEDYNKLTQALTMHSIKFHPEATKPARLGVLKRYMLKREAGKALELFKSHAIEELKVILGDTSAELGGMTDEIKNQCDTVGEVSDILIQYVDEDRIHMIMADVISKANLRRGKMEQRKVAYDYPKMLNSLGIGQKARINMAKCKSLFGKEKVNKGSTVKYGDKSFKVVNIIEYPSTSGPDTKEFTYDFEIVRQAGLGKMAERVGKGKQKWSCIVNCNLEYIVEADNEDEAQTEVENVELPSEYVSDSFDIVKIEKISEAKLNKVAEMKNAGKVSDNYAGWVLSGVGNDATVILQDKDTVNLIELSINELVDQWLEMNSEAKLRRLALRAFDVLLNDKVIDTVFYGDKTNVDEDEVRRSLIDHDGYDSGIQVKEQPPRGEKFRGADPLGKDDSLKIKSDNWLNMIFKPMAEYAAKLGLELTPEQAHEIERTIEQELGMNVIEFGDIPTNNLDTILKNMQGIAQAASLKVDELTKDMRISIKDHGEGVITNVSVNSDHMIDAITVMMDKNQYMLLAVEEGSLYVVDQEAGLPEEPGKFKDNPKPAAPGKGKAIAYKEVKLEKVKVKK